MNLANLETRFIAFQFGTSSRLKVYEKLSALMKNGVAINKAMKDIEAHMSWDGKKPKDPTAFAMREWRRNYEGGATFAESIKAWVPRDDVNIIAAGEVSGNLVETLNNVCYLTVAQKRMKSSVRSAVIYPLLLMVAGIGFMIFFGRNVIPAFDEVWPKENWYGLAASMRMIASFVENGLFPTIGVFVALALLSFWSLPRWTGKIRSKFDKVPPYSIYRLVVGSGFLLTMAIMMRSGIKISVGISKLMRYSSPWLTERLRQIHHSSSKGSDLAKSLHLLPYPFPDREIVNDLRTFSSQEGFDEKLLSIGKQSLETTISKIEAQANLLRLAGMFFMFGIIIWFVLGMFAIQDQVMQGVGQTAG
jgi:type II secretory pathway component PulF